ncbi:hypothetical protein [Thiovibrio frasassiensis]|uniref:Lipoprotein n=1 Tax=Thiovibrio frasassiensis TaxID=2984131 RepID=A0A9X4MFV6_9BACT|nr:hypothetical protein [Thiovibrio frasassiensis]MDG4475485.1 hypothetical protein [Thiovibrio frasassiensis]
MLADQRGSKRLLFVFCLRTLLLLVGAGLFSGCAQQFALKSETANTIFIAEQGEDVFHRHAPAFLVYEADLSHNCIGMAGARYDTAGAPEVFVDPDRPAIYVGEYSFATEKGNYRNLVYRVHFSRVPFRHITAGKHGGILVLITLNANKQPVLVSTVGTCGCYLTMTPTNFLPDSCLPEGFKREAPLRVYGETLPGSLDYAGRENPRLLVSIRPEVHRVMDLRLVDDDSALGSQGVPREKTDLLSVETLERLELPGGTETTSFFHEKGVAQGYVKGALKPWESLFMSPLALDFLVGMDKAYYGDPAKGQPLYTSLKPWAQDDSDLRDFRRFLSYWGWRL